MFLGLKQDFAQGTARPIDQLNQLWLMVHQAKEFYLLSNVCPHQRSKISQCSSTQLQCPYHGMAFDLQGQGIGNAFRLDRRTCFEMGNMLLLTAVKHTFPIDTATFDLVEHRQDQVNATVETIMDVFLDTDHIPFAHQGVYDQVGITSIDQLTYHVFAGGSIQYVPADINLHMIDADKHLNLGACWMALYPGTMIEWQPGALFVTVATPNAAGSQVQVYKYSDQRYSDLHWNNNNAVWETAWEQDRRIAESIVSVSHTNLNDLQSHHRDFYALL